MGRRVTVFRPSPWGGLKYVVKYYEKTGKLDRVMGYSIWDVASSDINKWLSGK